MKRTIVTVLMLISMLSSYIHAQELYDISTIRDLYLNFYDSDWEHTLDSLKDIDSKDRVLAGLIVDGTLYDSVGVRFKGNSSYNSTQQGDKRPFNIKLDFIKNHKLYGYTSLKLSNMFKDPSCVREVLSYEILRNYMPAPQSNYIKLTINDTLRGLYASTESINDDFVNMHFGSDTNSFFKCDPVSFSGPPSPPPQGCPPIPGMTSQLIFMSDDTACYKKSYDIKSDKPESWVSLKEMIKVLNQHPDYADSLLDIDRALWMLVFNNLFVNMDSYTGSGHNYYVYENHYGIFNTIPWDLNENFGVFTLGQDAQSMQTMSTDYGINDNSRPLIKKLLNIEDVRKRYFAHYRSMLAEQVANDAYYSRALEIRNIIDSSVQADPASLYTYSDFQNAMDQYSSSGSIIGISLLMNGRSDFLTSDAELNKQAPVIGNIYINPAAPVHTDPIWITSNITNTDKAWLHYKTDYYAPFIKTEMFDDGQHNDGIAGDGIYGGLIPEQLPATTVYYYLYAGNADAGKFSPERAEYEFYSFTVESVTINPLELVINEVLASNDSVQADNNGEYDDWIELYNNSGNTIQLSGMYLSDNISAPYKWSFPDTSISAGGFIIIWADKDDLQEGLHTNFKLSGSGESLYLHNSNGALIDSTNFGAQLSDTTWGRYPNGTGDFQLLDPTFHTVNSPLGIWEQYIISEFKIYPNPSHNYLFVEISKTRSESIELYNILQQKILSVQIEPNQHKYRISTSDYKAGIYFIKIGNTVQKLVID